MNSINIIYIIVPAALLGIAALVVRQVTRHGGLSPIVQVAIGALLLFALFVAWVVIYYAGGGH